MVTDPDTAGPVRIDAHSSAESGRGLQVVESCSVRWGWQPLDAWTLDRPGAHGGVGRAEGGPGRGEGGPGRGEGGPGRGEGGPGRGEGGPGRGEGGPGRGGKIVWALLQAPELQRITGR
jgi:hypothetical protein